MIHDPDPDSAAFVTAHTIVATTPLVPEIRLHLATEITPLWEAVEAAVGQTNQPPPYWAFAWVGGQAMARHILDHPHLVRGRRVLDFAAGCGIGAIACALAGAAHVTANEIDPFAAAAIRLNAALNGVAVEVVVADLVGGGQVGAWDVVTAGDVCYERPMASKVEPWLLALASGGATVLLADPGRAYLPSRGLVPLARHTVPTTRELEDRDRRDTTIYRLESVG
ncbi:MAG: 50S ribosomal protein L11 methyltransferase [Alphaproteobacteria bacterium]